jgi:hypothetical protein
MQTWTPKLAIGAFALALLSLTSCKKDEVQATLTPSNSPTLATTTTTVTLTQANAAQTAATFTWTPVTSLKFANADNKSTPAITYYLQVDKKGHNFGAPANIAAGAGPSTTVTVGDLNTALTSIGLTPGTATDVEVRLNASYASNSSTYSNVVTMKATSYKVCLAPAGSSAWSIIGPAGVDWSTDVPLTYNCNTNTFDVTRAMNAGEFKFRANQDWAVSYGSTTPRNASGTAPIDTNNNNNIVVPTAGIYTVSLDLNARTYTLK